MQYPTFPKVFRALFIALACLANQWAVAQVAPSAAEAAAYRGLHAAAWQGDTGKIDLLAATKIDVNSRDPYGRTPLHVATFARHGAAIRTLVRAGANLSALENDRYDAVTIAAVANDEESLRVLLSLGASAKGVWPWRSASFKLAPASTSAFRVAWWRGPPLPSTMDSITAVQCRLLTWSSGAPAAINCLTTPSCPRWAAAIRAVPSYRLVTGLSSLPQTGQDMTMIYIMGGAAAALLAAAGVWYGIRKKRTVA
jgi:LPXTG-motif cell wall-anchored protein